MKRLALVLAAFLSFALVPVGHAVVPPGPNGKIVFTSGRGGAPGNDDNAKIWMVNSLFGGTATQITTGTTRHSHPAWSPDRTKVAYSRSRTGADARDIYVRDLLAGTELQLTDTVNEDEDRAAWSPDGTEIAYGQAPDGNFGTPRDIFIRPSTGGAARNLAVSSVASEDKPVWSPDGQFIFYVRDTVPSTNSDIVKELADNTGAVVEVVNTADNDYQPNLSHDGTKLCFSRGGMSDSGASGVDVWTADANALNSNVVGFATSPTKGEFNCVWSPDDTKILHVRGVFTGGELVYAPYPGPGTTQIVADVAQHFDGNPDWAVNPSPTCDDREVEVGRNLIVKIPLTCTDVDGESVSLDLGTPPANGVLSSITNDDAVFYTPNVNFIGADQFTYTGSDGTSNAEPATVAVDVKAPAPPLEPNDTVRPQITRLKLTGKMRTRGAYPRISFRLSEPATVRISLAVKRRKNGKVRFKTIQSVTAKGKQGVNRVNLLRRLRKAGKVPQGRIRLDAGRFRIAVGARDAAGNRAKPKRKTFTVAPV
jgi:Tol biopolymer transport system component